MTPRSRAWSPRGPPRHTLCRPWPRTIPRWGLPLAALPSRKLSLPARPPPASAGSASYHASASPLALALASTCPPVVSTHLNGASSGHHPRRCRGPPPAHPSPGACCRPGKGCRSAPLCAQGLVIPQPLPPRAPPAQPRASGNGLPTSLGCSGRSLLHGGASQPLVRIPLIPAPILGGYPRPGLPGSLPSCVPISPQPPSSPGPSPRLKWASERPKCCPLLEPSSQTLLSLSPVGQGLMAAWTPGLGGDTEGPAP